MRGLIEGLERRQLFSGACIEASHGPDGNITGTIHNDDGTTREISINPKTATYAEAVANSLLVLRFEVDGNVSTMMTFAPPSDRAGVFALPTIKADGSANVAGSDGDDGITVEATTGVIETKDEKGSPSDGEHDLISAIDPATGERYLVSDVTGNAPAQALERCQNQLNGAKRWLEHVRSGNSTAPEGDDLAEAEARVAAYETQLARAQAVVDSLTSGRFVHYTLKGVYDYYAQIADDQPTTARVTIDAGAGNDSVSISPNVPMKAMINGGSGADVLTTGKKTTNVFAGGGKDRLINRSTKGATLDGGQGADRYFNKTTADVDVVGRDDGDQMVFSAGAITLTEATRIGGVPSADGTIAYRLKLDVRDDGTVEWSAVEIVQLGA